MITNAGLSHDEADMLDEAWAKDARWESFLRNVCEALGIEKPVRCSNPEPSEWEARVLAAIKERQR